VVLVAAGLVSGSLVVVWRYGARSRGDK
jgi:hypothetical protein